MKGFYDRLKTMLEQEPSVRMAVSVEGEHPGMQVLWSDPEIWTSGDRELAEQWVAQLWDAVSGSCVQLENDPGRRTHFQRTCFSWKTDWFPCDGRG